MLLLFLLWHPACADVYDPLLLRAQASIYPKIVLLDQDLVKKMRNGNVVITIVSTHDDASVANELKENILAKYANRLGDNPLDVNVATFGDIDQLEPATAYIVMQADKSSFEKVVAYASSNERIVFSYSYTNLKNDALISLLVKEKTYIYVNKSTVKTYGINFLPVFYKIIKLI
ncbi:hypothetical protein ACFL3P_02160 [Pseudomonadota bacterium]